MHTYTDLCLAHPLESRTPFDIVVNSASALLSIPVTYKPINDVNSPFIRYSGTSAYNICIKVDTFGGCNEKFSSFVFELTVTILKPYCLSVAQLLKVSLRFSIVKFQFTVCAVKAPLVKVHSHGAFFALQIHQAVSCRPPRSYPPINRRIDV